MKLTPRRRYISPGDGDKELSLPFSVAELKTLQGIVLDRIQHDAEEQNAAFKPHLDLATKLEYYLSDLETSTGA